MTAVPRGATVGGETGLGQRDHVHIAFGDDQGLALARRLTRGAVVVKVAALVEQIGFRAVQVFRPRIRVQRAPAKADRAAARIADRKDDARRENDHRAPAIIGLGAKPRCDDQIGRDALGVSA